LAFKGFYAESSMLKITQFSQSQVLRFSFLFVFIVSSIYAFSQEKSNKGKEFWLGFMNHIEGTDAGMSLYITSDSNTTGTVSVPGQSWSTNFSVTANSLTIVTIPSATAYINCSDCIQNKAVNVTAAKDVIVYAHHYEGNKSDATLVLPARTQGKEYYVMAYEQSSPSNGGRSEFIIVASKDSTVVNITPTVDLTSNSGGTLSANTTYQKVLDAGDIYQGMAKYGTSAYDITGTHIEVIDTGSTANCRTVAVFSGSSYTRIGNCSGGWGTFNSGDNLFEQMFPINSWGKKFVLVPALGRTSDNFRFLAAEDNTQVWVYKNSGAPDILYLDKGEFDEIKDVNYTRAVIATKPVMAAQFQKTSRCDGQNRVGDPSMTILNPLEQTLKNITLYSSQYYDIDNHYINVVIPTHAASSFRIDGNTASFSTVPQYSAYSYTRLTVTAGNHRLTASTGFVATAYGEGEFESYGYAAGANVKDLRATIEVANSPLTTEVSNCIGTATEFRGDAEYNVVRWEWDFGDGNTDTVQNPNHMYADTGVYLVRLYTYKPQFDGCSNYDSVFVEVHVYASPKAILYKENLCDSSTALFRDSSTVDAPESYLTTKWTINGGPDQYGRTVTKFFDTTGKYSFRMITITNHQCKDTISDSITISPNPIVAFSVENSCYFDSSFFNNLTTIDSGGIGNYIWDFGDGDSSTLQHPVHYYSDSGYHYIELTAISDSGCVARYSDSLYKLPKFEVAFDYTDTCFDFQNIFTNTTILEGGIFTDTAWYTSENDTFYSYNMSKTFGDPGTHQVQLIMEQDSFCRDTFTQTIQIHSLAVPNFSVFELCYGDSTEFTDITNYPDGTYTRAWDFDDGVSGTDTIENVKYTTNGTKTVELTITTDNGCETTITQTLTITKPEILTIYANDVCENVAQDISALLSTGLDSFISYNWYINGVVVSTDSAFVYSPTDEGKKIIELIVNTDNGCVISMLDSINVFDVPQSVFSINSVCKLEDLIPDNQSTINAPAIITKYTWLVNNTLASNIKDPIIPTTLDGSVDIMLITESSDGCKDTLVRSANIHPLPIAGFISDDVCVGDVTTFTDNSFISLGTMSQFNWLIDGQNMSGNSTTYQFNSTGTYNVYLQVESDKGCRDSITKPIDINPLPVIDVSISDADGCVPFAPEFVNNSTIESGTIQTYTWYWGDGNSSTGNNPLHYYTDVGTFTINVVGLSDKGCKDSVTLGTNITVFDDPIADFSYTPNEIQVVVTDVLFTDESSSDVTAWEWNVRTQQYTTPSFKHTFQDSGYANVQLVVTNNNGCRDTIVKRIYIDASLFVHIPDAFSPNGDLRNDEFGLGGLTNAVVDLKFVIYNRWGEQIFESNHPDDKWDGTYQGVPSPTGIYLYQVQFTDPKHTKWRHFSGTVKLLR
jgi:gliding motility-associated-like protein